jgi:hypothetical protein
MIGAIALTGIIVATFGIIAALFVPMIKPVQIPHVKLSIACAEHIDEYDTEFPCTHGSFSCFPLAEPFDAQTCEHDCMQRAYAKSHQYQPRDYSRLVSQCKEKCIAPFCSTLATCHVIYICHNGGDALEIANMKIFVNGDNVPPSNWEKKELHDDHFKEIAKTSNMFQAGTILRVQNIHPPVDRVMITYTLPSGSDITLLLNQFGTDVKLNT